MKNVMSALFLVLATVVSQAETFKVDFSNSAAGNVQSGYYAYYASHEVPATFSTQTYGVFGSTVSVTPTWAPGAVAAAMQMMDRATKPYEDATEDLMRDWIGTDTRSAGDPLTLTIGGLPAGTYTWTSYHHDTDGPSMGQFDVTVNDAAGSNTTYDIQITGRDDTTTLDGVSKFKTTIISDGSDITLVFDNHPIQWTWNDAWFVMNGFELTQQTIVAGKVQLPEPANGTLFDPEDITTLAWQGSTDPNIVSIDGYDLVFGTNPDMAFNTTYTNVTSSFDLGSNGIVLDYSMTYYWRVDSHITWDSDEITGNFQEVVVGDTWSFGTKPAPMPYPYPTDPMTVSNSVGVILTVGSNGTYVITFDSPAKTFSGYLSQGITGRTNSSGTDNIGDYSAISFNYTSAAGHAASIRLYDSIPVVLFSDNTLVSSSNDRQFPKLVADTTNMKHISYGDTAFGVYTFSQLYDYTGSPWMFFDQNHDVFIFSAASNYIVATNNGDGTVNSPFNCGVDGEIGTLPADFTHQTILVAENGIDQTLQTWGNSLQALVGRTAPANDAVIELEKLSYWTDNGAYYYGLYYWTGIQPTVESDMTAMRDEFISKGVPFASIQLDSWFYPKGNNNWRDFDSGFYLYEAADALFPDDNGNGNGLDDFYESIGVPIITHCRWVDNNGPQQNVDAYISPYVGQYEISGGMIIDLNWWEDRMNYLNSNGVTTFEQDWLSYRGVTEFNLYDPFGLFDNMAQACQNNGLNMQYCMAQPHHILQGIKYPNLMTVRCSEDDWNYTRWRQFIYDSHYIQHLGIWGWTDVTMSTETRNMLLSTLSAGPVGPGDQAGTVSAVNINRVARPDSVIVKPDMPLKPLDQTYINDAWGLGGPFVGATYTDFGALRPLYIFAFGNASDSSFEVNLNPSEIGMNSDAYVYDYFGGSGALVTMGNSYTYDTQVAHDTNGGTYHILAPIGPSGLALIGDVGKFVTLGKKRVSQLTDDGTLTATVVFAPTESSVNLLGYSPTYPDVTFSQGSGGVVTYNLATHLFTLTVSPHAGGTAVVQLTGDGIAPPAPQAPTGLTAQAISSSQIDLSWNSSEGAASYNVKRATTAEGPYVMVFNGFQTTWSDTGLVAATTYFYLVSAVNGGGQSADSSMTYATTLIGPITTALEAEDAVLNGNLTIASSNRGYSGTGYVDYSNTQGDYVEWSINADSGDDTYSLRFHYANGGVTDRPLELRVNGVLIGVVNFPPTGGWAAWNNTTVQNVALNTGLNTVRLEDFGSNGANVDCLELTIVPSNTAPVFTVKPISNANGIELAAYAGNSLATYVSDVEGILTVTFSKDSGPDWLDVASNGDLSGVPQDSNVDENSFTVRVTDNGGLSDTAMMTIWVFNVYSGVRGMEDLIGLNGQWLSMNCTDTPSCDGADLDGDNNVTLSDFCRLADRWMDEAI